MFEAFIIQLQFLTRFPIPIKTEFKDDKFSKGTYFYPVIGLIIGLFLALVYKVTSLIQFNMLSVFSVVIAEIIITGALHLDGLADTFDGIYSYRTKERMLEIMKDSRIGTNGIMVLLVVIPLKTLLLFYLSDYYNFWKVLVVMPVFSRLGIVYSAMFSEYAGKSKGLGTAIVNDMNWKKVIITTLQAVLIGAFCINFHIAGVFIGVFLFVLFFTAHVKSKIGGVTGDILGAVVELSEVVLLIVLLLSFKYGATFHSYLLQFL